MGRSSLHFSGIGRAFLLFLSVTLVWAGSPNPATAQDAATPSDAGTPSDDATTIQRLLESMTLEEKVGQMTLRGRSSRSKDDPRLLEAEVREGRIGAMLNVMDKEAVDRLQEVATTESRHGIPLLFGRDVIHGFRTIFPIPLAQAASFDMPSIRQAAAVSALEANTYGIRWTFAPMVDITRDPRWGRIAESPGEDPYLAEQVAIASVQGFQGDDLTAPGTMAACVKHFAAYGAAVGGRDYNSAPVPGALLHNVYLRPFLAGIEAGAASMMTAFNEVDGIPATAHPYLLREVLRDRWKFDGFVVSDWESVTEMIAHGFSADAPHAARQAALAGVDLEMTSRSYQDHLADAVRAGDVPESVLDEAVANVLRIKLRLGLFDNAARTGLDDSVILAPEHLELARTMAQRSVVLLTNDGVLPLASDVPSVAVIGPLADAPHEQLGTWTFDGKKENSVTPVAALRQRLGDDRVRFVAALSHSRDRQQDHFAKAVEAARAADVVLFFGGEEAILSGEAHSRANLDLPGAQEDLIHALAETGKPIVLVVMSGRPNTLGNVLEHVGAVLVAWHPGTMAGPALADLLFGEVAPSGRLPVTWPRTVGQIPIFYNHKSTGRPAPPDVLNFDDIPVGAWQSSLSNTSRYLDLTSEPIFPFGFGLTYSRFEYTDLTVGSTLTPGGTLTVEATVHNRGERDATEVVQLYVRDLVASSTRPVQELKGFQRVEVAAGASQRVRFELPASDLSFFDAQGRSHLEPGDFHLWVAPHAGTDAGLQGSFTLQAETSKTADAGASP